MNLGNQMMNSGYLYVCYSEDGRKNRFFRNQFLVSYESLKRVVPNSNVTLYTNINFENDLGINNVIYDKNIEKSHIAKAVGLLKSPYDKTIFLDTDTVVHRPVIDTIFEVLDEFDFTCCHASQHYVRTIYPDLNTGLLGVKKNDFTDMQIANWSHEFQTLFQTEGIRSDQYSFRNIFMKYKKHFYILPPWFQFRPCNYSRYIERAVITHDKSMCRKTSTQAVIKYLETPKSPSGE